MSQRSLLLVAATLFLGACDVLDTNPPDRLSPEKTIQTPAGARTALAGAYNELQDGYYYGGTMTHFGDLYADNANEVGTFTSYKSAADRDLFADNSDITGMWNHIYDAIKRANTLIQRVPAVEGFAPGEKEQILGEAHFLRALNYHNLVRHFGGVPLRLEPLSDPGSPGDITRATSDEVYAQIEADLTEATNLITATSGVNHATVGAVLALRARIASWRGQSAQAITLANQVEALGYALTPTYQNLFNSDEAVTVENILSLTFTSDLDQANLLGYYWLSDQLDGSAAGRFEIGPTRSLIDAYDTLSTDVRLAWNIIPDPADGSWTEATQAGGSYGHKFPTPNGAEDFPILRFAEMLLIKADAFARLNQLDSAVANVNRIRVRAGIAALTLGGTIPNTQAAVLAEVSKQRRLEFAEEGDRWGDLVRTGEATTLLAVPINRQLWPIPQAEIDVAPGVEQNPGY